MDCSLDSYKQMDNFHLQVTPVELTYQSKDPVVLSCLIKKVLPSGGAPERYEVRPYAELVSGRATFHQGATFAMNKEMELNSTRISLNFFNRNDRNPSLIGTTDLELASLPPHPYTLLELKLDHCTDPKARLKLQIQRKDTQLKPAKKEVLKPQQMGILRTQGQIREEAMMSRRVNPTIPTAYEISRRNYVQHPLLQKQVETSFHEDKKSEGRKNNSNSSKKGSYLQQRMALQGKTSKITVKKEEKQGESPVPRKQTPQPIRIGEKVQSKQPAQQISKYAISKGVRPTHSHSNSVHTQPNPTTSLEDAQLEPQKLNVRPYRKDENINKVNQATIKYLQEEKSQKYENIRNIVEKLQLIHDKIVQSKDRQHDQSEAPSECSQLSNFHRSCFEDRENLPAAVNSFSHLPPSNHTSLLNTSKILEDSDSSASQKGLKVPREEEQSNLIEKQFQNIKSVKAKSPDASPASEKTVDIKVIPPNHNNNNPNNINLKIQKTQSNDEELTNEREMELMEIEGYKQEIKSLKADLSSALRSVSQRDRTIATLQQDLNHYKQLLQEKQLILNKLTQQYETRFEQVFALKERVASFEEEKALQKEKSTTSDPRKSEEAKSLNEQLIKAKKRILQVESQLRFKQNENKCLLLEMDNLKREKTGLQQQVQVLVSKDKNEMTRKASLARIEQINSNSLANHAKRENEALRNEVKLLQQKLQALNGLFESLLSPSEKEKARMVMPKNDSGQAERRAKLMEEKCGLLEQELKQKKNQLAEIINIIWSHQDGDIMNDVLNLISTEAPPA